MPRSKEQLGLWLVGFSWVTHLSFRERRLGCASVRPHSKELFLRKQTLQVQSTLAVTLRSLLRANYPSIVVAPTASMATKEAPFPWHNPALRALQKKMRRQTRASLRALQSSPVGQDVRETASSVVSTPLAAPTALSGGELVARRRSADHQIQASDGESDVTHALPEESTPSTQQKLLDRADAGDFQARLELVSPRETETELARMRRRDKPNQTVLDFLRHPGDGITPAQAAARVLNEFTTQTEEISTETLYVWRYVQLNEMWKPHENPKNRSLKAFAKSLDQEDLLMALLMMGTITQSNKRQSILAIHRSWGLDWFDSIPKDLLPPDVTSPAHLSKRLLLQIAVTCKRGVSLDDAINQWKESLEARLGGRVQRASRDSRISQKRYILPDDINRLYQTPTKTDQAAQKALENSIREIKQDRIQLKAPAKLRTLAPKPDAKRKRDSTGTEPGGERQQKRLSKDGTKELVRVRNHLIVRPVSREESADGASQLISQAEGGVPPSAQRDPNRSIFITDTDSEEEPFQDLDDAGDSSQPQSCEGALILGRLADQVSWSQDGRECCNRCRTAIASVQHTIDRAVADIAAAHR